MGGWVGRGLWGETSSGLVVLGCEQLQEGAWTSSWGSREPREEWKRGLGKGEARGLPRGLGREPLQKQEENGSWSLVVSYCQPPYLEGGNGIRPTSAT